jgi:predicted O-linked N-acetylglucosamine transferase (SPINDLY family)
VSEAFTLAVQHHRAGRLDVAGEIYRRVLQAEPQHAEALHLLGVIAHQTGDHAAAIEDIGRAIAMRPGEATYHSNLGEAYRALGRTAEAMDCYGRAVELNPDCVQAHNNLGNTLRGLGRFDEAVGCYRQAIQRRPDYADAHVNLGNALKDLGRLDEAAASYRRAVELVPDHAHALSNLGLVLLEQEQVAEAVSCCRRAVELWPTLAEAHNNLGNALYTLGQVDEALAALRRALELKPDLVEALANLGGVYKDLAQPDESLACYRRAVELAPASAAVHSNLIYAMHFHPGCDARSIAAEQRRWVERHAAPLARCVALHANDRSPDRRLRIGYVSADFRQHVVGLNLLPLFERHDHERFEIVAYDDAACPDHVGDRLRGAADAWRRVFGWSDAQIAEQIRADRIDILVDLALHTAHNRLTLFARKPAPVQVSFAGYPGSTGLPTIDYRLTDPHLDPPGVDEADSAGAAFRLPDTFWCYAAASQEPTVSALPAAQAGHITFGCLGNFGKSNPAVWALWAQVLRRVNRSRLLLRAAEGAHRERLRDALAAEGVTPDRLSFVATQTHDAYLKVYHGVDLGLDTFPYNGHTTSLDALWMGVPVITLVGQTAVGRAGLSQLTNLGLPELAATSAEQYVEIAVALAEDLPRLAALRATLRQRMQNSPLMDSSHFARSIEDAYRTMWRRWCAETPGTSAGAKQ